MPPTATPAHSDAVSEATAAGRFGPAAIKRRIDELREHYDRVSEARVAYVAANGYYYDQIHQLLTAIIRPQKRVLQIGCHTPDYLAAVAPAAGVGVDLSPRHVRSCRTRFPQLRFYTADEFEFGREEAFDYVLMVDINDQVDPMATLRDIRPAMHEQTRLIILHYNHLWVQIVRVAERLGLKFRSPRSNWLSPNDLNNMLRLCNYERLQVHRRVLLPKRVPVLSWLANAFLARLPLFDRLTMVKVTVARPERALSPSRDYSVSVVIPCRNEVGNVAAAVERIPEMGRHTEIIFCDDKSTDGTADEVRRLQKAYPHRDIKLYDGPGVCKALNVHTGFDRAKGDMLMILDADLTTMPEELPLFYDALATGKAEFVNGTRFVLPMEGAAMRPLNMIGNRFFSSLFSYLIGRRITDTLCGTKVLWRRDWPVIRSMVGTWGTADRWGDYDLIFGAAKMHLRIVDMPVHYQERVSGQTKMTGRVRNGLIMLRKCWAAFLKFKLG
jgi:hypothetical protein